MPRRPKSVPRTCHFRFAILEIAFFRLLFTHVEFLHSSDDTSKNPSTLFLADLYRRLPKVDILHSSFSGRFQRSLTVSHVTSISDALDNLVGLVVLSMQLFENS